MNRYILSIMALLTIAIAPFAAQAGQYQQRVVITTTMIGATTGAVIGSSHGRTGEGAMIGGILGAVTGVMLSRHHDQRPYAYRGYRTQRSSTVIFLHRPAYRQHVYHHGHYGQARHPAHERYEQRMEHACRGGYRQGHHHEHDG